MSIPEPDTMAKPNIAQGLVRVEVEVPEDAVESLRAFVASLRSAASAQPKDFKEMLESAPGDDAFWDDVAASRDKRPGRDIDL